MKFKLFSFFIIFLLIFQINSSGKTCINKSSDSLIKSNNSIKVLCKDYGLSISDNNISYLSFETAQKLKKKLCDIYKNYRGMNSIYKQVNLLKDYEIFPSEFSVNKLKNFANFINSSFNRSKLRFKAQFNGPMIVSHFTMNGRIKGLPVMDIFSGTYRVNFSNFLNGSYFDGFYGFLPYYMGFSFNPVFVSVYGKKLDKNLFSPFFEILFPCIGTSVAFKNKQGNTIFEYNLDMCLAGILGGCEI